MSFWVIFQAFRLHLVTGAEFLDLRIPHVLRIMLLSLKVYIAAKAALDNR